MNYILELLKKRKSVRNFSEKTIDYETINYILSAGRLAPSGGNEQPWYFGVVDEKYQIEKIAQFTYRQRWIEKSPLIIVLCTDTSKTKESKGIQSQRFPELKDIIYNIENDVYKSLNLEEHQTKIPGTQMMLAALEKGIYTTWVSKFQIKEIQKILKLPEHIIPSELLVMGYPNESTPTPSKKEIKEICFFNRYTDSLNIFYKRLKDIQPSQLYLSREKLAIVDKCIKENGFDEKHPVPIIKIYDKIVLSDGHTRAYAAYTNGIDKIPVYWDDDQLNIEAYRICVDWCIKSGITSVADLKNRIVSSEKYKKLWLDRCKKMHEQLNKSNNGKT